MLIPTFPCTFFFYTLDVEVTRSKMEIEYFFDALTVMSLMDVSPCTNTRKEYTRYEYITTIGSTIPTYTRFSLRKKARDVRPEFEPETICTVIPDLIHCTPRLHRLYTTRDVIRKADIAASFYKIHNSV